MGAVSSVQRQRPKDTKDSAPSFAVVSLTGGKHKVDQPTKNKKSGNKSCESNEMGTRAVKANASDDDDSTENSFNGNTMSMNDRHLDDWRAHMTSIVDRLQSEAAEKDARIEKLAKQAKEATEQYEKQRIPSSKMSNSPEANLIETLQHQIQKLEACVGEKDEVIRSLQRQLLQSRTDKESQVSVLKDSVEMVIREKDSEIRRLKALWSPSDALPADVVDASIVSNISRATKLLNAPELGSGKKSGRFGISAENRTSSQKILHDDVVPKSIAQAKFISQALNTNVFLKGLDSDQVDQLVECMSLNTITSGADVISEGEFGSYLYVLDTGLVEVYHMQNGLRCHVTDLKPGAVFGELAILYNCKRTASVRAKCDVNVWCLERTKFQAAVKRSGQLKRNEYVRLLKTVEKLKSLSDNKLLRIADCVEEATFYKGDYIIRQGDAGDTFYIIQSGKVKVTHTEKDDSKKNDYQEKFVCFLEKGKYFGESALLTEDKRSANIIVESNFVSALMLDRQAFSSLVGSIADIQRIPSDSNLIPLSDSSTLLSIDAIAEETFEEEPESVVEVDGQDKQRDTITPTMNKKTEAILKTVTLDKLRPLKILGQGGFGCVKLVTVPGIENGAFALKSIRKAKIVKTGQQQHVLAEKNILLAVRSPFIGRLYRTFKDDWKIYMLMDAYLGGEVYNVLKRYGALDEPTARFCSACVLEALDYLHRRGIVYRDLKPENIMLDHKGYVKLVDFGFAKRLQIGFKTWTFCGTPEYFPPEVLANRGHDFSADLWSYGILVYEFLTRTTPFYASDDMTVYENILSGIEGVRFSKRITKHVEVLVRGLCKLEPRNRLGYQKGGIGDIRKQRWFQGFDWQGLRANRIPSPFNVDVKGPTDTKHFELILEDPMNKSEDRKILQGAKMQWDDTF